MMPVKVSHLTRLRKLQRVLARAKRTGDAEALDALLLTIDDHFAHSRNGHDTKDLPPPVFTVTVRSNYNGSGRLLSWASRGNVAKLVGKPATVGGLDGYVDYGTFACYPTHDGGPLIEDKPGAAAELPAPMIWPFPVSAHQEAR